MLYTRCGRLSDGPQRWSHRNPQHLSLHMVKGTVQMYKVKGSELGRLSWIIQMDPVEAQNSCTGGAGELGSGRGGRMDTEGCSLKMEEGP